MHSIRNHYQILGINPSTLGDDPIANLKKIRKAYQKLARDFHPDKNPDADPDMIRNINTAYQVLTDPTNASGLADGEGAGYGAVVKPLPTTGERRSHAFRQVFDYLRQSDFFTRYPLESFSETDKKSALERFDDLIGNGFLDAKYYQKLYCAEGGAVECRDPFDLAAHQSKWSEPQAPLSADFFGEISPEKAITIVLGFLYGKYYGENLTKLQRYLAPLKDSSFLLYRAVSRLISVVDFSIEYETVLQAIEDIHAPMSQQMDGSYDFIELIQSKQFRYLTARSLVYFWNSKPSTILPALQRLHREDDSPKSLLGKAITDIEDRVSRIFFKEASLEEHREEILKEIYECAYLMIDLQTCLPSLASVNAGIIAAQCFQQAAKWEQEPRQKMAAECLALEVYQRAMYSLFHMDAFAAPYAGTLMVKYLSEFQYRGAPEDKLREALQHIPFKEPADKKYFFHGSAIDETMRSLAERTLYFIDILPFFSKLKPCIELSRTHIHQIKLMRESLRRLIDQETRQTTMRHSKVLYHAYDASVFDTTNECGLLNRLETPTKEERDALTQSQYILTEDGLYFYNKITAGFFLIEWDAVLLKKLHETFPKSIDSLLDTQSSYITHMTGHTPARGRDEQTSLMMQAIHELLAEHDLDTFSITQLLGDPFSPIKYDTKGWRLPTNHLNYPAEAGVPTYSSFDGYVIDLEKATITFKLTEVAPRDPAAMFSRYDVKRTIYDDNVKWGILSMEHPDSTKRFHPLQSVFYEPAKLFGTPFLDAMDHADYTLKQFVSRTVKSNQPPYAVGSTDHLYRGVPPHIQRILNLCGESDVCSANRFWITAGKIEMTQKTEGSCVIVSYGNIDMIVQQHLLQHNATGDLVDAADSADDSKEAEFAREMTRAYDEIGLYFPELLRLKEFIKIAGAVRQLKTYYKHLLTELAEFKQQAGKGQLEVSFQEEVEHVRPQLQSKMADFPKFSFTETDPDVIVDYNKQYKENYDRIYKEAYDSMYLGTEKSIIAESGQAEWDRQKARWVAEVEAEATRHATEALKPLMAGILEGYHAVGSDNRREYFQGYYQEFLHAKGELSEAAYSAIINAFLDKNEGPLLNALAKYSIAALGTDLSSRIDRYERLIVEFQKIFPPPKTEAEKKAKQETKEPKPPLFVPSVFNVRNGRYVHGGVCAAPRFSKVSSLSNSLFYGSDAMRGSALYQTPSYLANVPSTLGMGIGSVGLSPTYGNDLAGMRWQLQCTEQELARKNVGYRRDRAACSAYEVDNAILYGRTLSFITSGSPAAATLAHTSERYAPPPIFRPLFMPDFTGAREVYGQVADPTTTPVAMPIPTPCLNASVKPSIQAGGSSVVGHVVPSSRPPEKPTPPPLFIHLQQGFDAQRKKMEDDRATVQFKKSGAGLAVTAGAGAGSSSTASAAAFDEPRRADPFLAARLKKNLETSYKALQKQCAAMTVNLTQVSQWAEGLLKGNPSLLFGQVMVAHHDIHEYLHEFITESLPRYAENTADLITRLARIARAEEPVDFSLAAESVIDLAIVAVVNLVGVTLHGEALELFHGMQKVVRENSVLYQGALERMQRRVQSVKNEVVALGQDTAGDLISIESASKLVGALMRAKTVLPKRLVDVETAATSLAASIMPEAASSVIPANVLLPETPMTFKTQGVTVQGSVAPLAEMGFPEAMGRYHAYLPAEWAVDAADLPDNIRVRLLSPSSLFQGPLTSAMLSTRVEPIVIQQTASLQNSSVFLYVANKGNPSALQYTMDIMASVWTGILQGVGDFGYRMAHPYDSFIAPIGSLMQDAATIHSEHFLPSGMLRTFSTDAEVEIREMMMDTTRYQDAVCNMEERWVGAGNALDAFVNAPTDTERTRMAARFMTGGLLTVIPARFFAPRAARMSLLEDFSEPIFPPGTVGAAKVWSNKGRLKAVHLPTSGKVRFVPPEGYDARFPLPRGVRGGYMDRFGNEWIKGPSRTIGATMEWDVQLSRMGERSFANFSKSGHGNDYINVSPNGHISH